MRPSSLIPGGSRERAQILRRAIAEGRTVSVGYRKGGMLEVRDLTGCTVWVIERGRWYRDQGQRVFIPLGVVAVA